ncbi:UNVERIFIED_CONTAM: enhancer of mRNA decapping [Siphonaria sp. JEL0065]|nr:enhancer of mRNA decapping [Siphonaria sp. JEL0065]
MDFTGLRVQLLLANGHTIVGDVSSAQSGTLVVNGQAVPAEAIIDLSVLAPLQTPVKFVDPAIVSMARPHGASPQPPPTNTIPLTHQILSAPVPVRQSIPAVPLSQSQSQKTTKQFLFKPPQVVSHTKNNANSTDDEHLDFATLSLNSNNPGIGRSTPVKQRSKGFGGKPSPQSPGILGKTVLPKKRGGATTPQQPSSGSVAGSNSSTKTVKESNGTKGHHHRTGSHQHHQHKSSSAIVVEPTVDISQDFDFQTSLEKFDKQRVFAEIRASEEELGVGSGGGAGGFNGKDRIGVHEMVLESGEETGNNASAEEDFDDNSDDYDDDELDDSQFQNLEGTNNIAFILGENKGNMPTSKNKKRPVFKSVGGVAVYGITTIEMAEVERLAVAETGPNETQMIENAGRGAAMLVMQALGGARRIKVGNHNSAPCVVVLAGNNKVGAYGLCTARHLANHEVNVIVVVVGSEAELVNTVSYQRKIYLPTGGQIVKQVNELPFGTPVDLIVDALLGSTQQILDLPEIDRSLACDLMRWANDNRANVLSLDIPSGFNHTTGLPSSQAHHISAKWTLSFGLPKSCLAKIAREFIGELFLSDIGIPKIVYQKLKVAPKAGAKGEPKQPIRYIPPFGDKYLVGLTYNQ